MEQTKITVHHVGTGNDAPLHPLYEHYSGQTEPQPAYIQLDCREGTLSANVNGEIGNAVPFSVWHGHDKRYTVSFELCAKSINSVLDYVAPLAQQICDAYESHWDGSNEVAKFTLEGDVMRTIEEEIQSLCYSLDKLDDTGVWEADEWLENIATYDDDKTTISFRKGSVFVIRPQTTDDELQQAADFIEKEARFDDCTVVGIYDYLKSQRSLIELMLESVDFQRGG